MDVAGTDDVASTLVATAEVGTAVGGTGLVAWSPVFLVMGTIHSPVWVHLWPQMIVRPLVGNGAVDLCEGYRASGIANGDDGE